MVFEDLLVGIVGSLIAAGIAGIVKRARRRRLSTDIPGKSEPAIEWQTLSIEKSLVLAQEAFADIRHIDRQLSSWYSAGRMNLYREIRFAMRDCGDGSFMSLGVWGALVTVSLTPEFSWSDCAVFLLVWILTCMLLNSIQSLFPIVEPIFRARMPKLADQLLGPKGGYRPSLDYSLYLKLSPVGMFYILHHRVRGRKRDGDFERALDRCRDHLQRALPSSLRACDVFRRKQEHSLHALKAAWALAEATELLRSTKRGRQQKVLPEMCGAYSRLRRLSIEMEFWAGDCPAWFVLDLPGLRRWVEDAAEMG